MKRILLAIVATLLFSTSAVWAEQVSFSWQANPIEDGVDHYNFYRGDTTGVYDAPIDVGNVVNYIVDLPKGVHYLTVTAVDVAGNESGISYEIRKEIFISSVNGFGSP